MGKFFTSTYEEYYNSLCNNSDLKTSCDNLRDLVSEANNRIDQYMLIVGEGLEGQYCNELEDGLTAIKDELTASQEIINNDLENVVSTIEALVPQLKQLKDLDIKYEAIENDLVELNNKLNEVQKSEYLVNATQSQINAKEATKAQYESEINTLITEIENKINVIVDFNNTIVTISMAISSFENSGVDVTGFEDLTVEEREEVIRQLISAFTEQYAVYKEAYEKYAKWDLTEEELNVFTTVLSALGITGVDAGKFDMKSILDSAYKNDFVGLGFQTKELLDVMITHNLKESMENYFVKGQSWIESGMDAIAKEFSNDDLFLDESGQEYMASMRERTFLTGLYGRKDQVGKYKDNKEEVYNLFASAYDKLESNNNLFLKNYNDCVNTGISIKGLESRLKTVKYDDIFNSDDYSNYKAQFSSGKSGYSEDYSILPPEEKRRYEYLYEKYGASKAAQYMSDIDDFVTYTKGIKRGEEVFQQIHDGNLDGLEALGIGYGDGFVSFINGFPNVVSPQHTLTENDYARMQLIKLMDENPYDFQKTLYDIGHVAGGATIPGAATAITYFTPGLRSAAPYVGIGLHTVSGLGNHMAEQTLAAEYDLDPNNSVTWSEAFTSCAPQSLVEFVSISFTQAAILPHLGENITYFFSGTKLPAWISGGTKFVSGVLIKGGERYLIRNHDGIITKIGNGWSDE